MLVHSSDCERRLNLNVDHRPGMKSRNQNSELLFLRMSYRTALAGQHRLAAGLVRPRMDTKSFSIT
jgi:hypothetical protein